MVKLSRRSAVSVALIGLAMGIGGCKPMPDTIKIGVAQPLSGDLAALGKDMVNGVQLAVDELNKVGYSVDGKLVMLELVVVDDKSDAAEGKKVAQQLVDAGEIGRASCRERVSRSV